MDKEACIDSLFEELAVGIAIVATDGIIKRVNSKLATYLVASQEDLSETHLLDITHPEDQQKDAKDIEDLISSKITQFKTEKRIKNFKGRYIWTMLTYAIRRHQNSTDFIIIFQDISDRKQAELALEESNKSLERFAYVVSHDLQEPLRKICSFAQRLNYRLEQQALDDTSRFELDRITHAANRMSQMINSLLNLSRITRHQLTLSELKLSEIIATANDLLALQIQETNTVIELENDSTCCGDSNLLCQLFQNLIANSIHYKQDDVSPHIKIRHQITEDQQIEVYIKDNGLGIEQEDQEFIFTPFKRMTDKHDQGQGMGLAICQQIMQAHGGTIKIAESKISSGTEFVLKFPREFLKKSTIL